MSDMFGAGSSMFSGLGNAFGDFAEAAGSSQAAALYGQAAQYSELGGKIKDMMLRRQAFQVIGGTQSDVAGSGLKMSGTAVDVLRSNAQQASLSRAVTDVNTRIQVNSYTAQEDAAKAAASAQTDAGIGGLLSTAMSAASFI